MAGFVSVRNTDLSCHNDELALLRRDLKGELYGKYSSLERHTLKELHELKIYSDYYKRFRKTYHVLLQLESVALKGKDIPVAPPFVQIMFMAELKNLLLTAVHDFAKISLPVTVRSAVGDETYVTMGGKAQTLKKGDLFMTDQEGIISSIIYGPDERTRVSSNSTEALYAIYAPPGISRQQIENHILYIRKTIDRLSEGSSVQSTKIIF